MKMKRQQVKFSGIWVKKYLNCQHWESLKSMTSEPLKYIRPLSLEPVNVTLFG
jgi:hypothetical protein